MPIGIEKMDLYAGQAKLSVEALALARGADPAQVRDSLMNVERSVYSAYEDAVTMAVNAGRRLLGPDDAKDIGLLVVGTESSIDQAKATSTWVHNYLGLPENCRNFEVKHACYAGMAALKTALMWIAAQERPGKKALVICTDASRGPSAFQAHPNAEFVAGGGAVAMLVSDKPELLSFNIKDCGYWTKDISDYMRPTAATEWVDPQLSMFSYLDALDGAYEDYLRHAGPKDFTAYFSHHIYHAPFPAMTLKAHRCMLDNQGGMSAAEQRQHFDARVLPGLIFNQRIGTTYGASIFISLLGLLEAQRAGPGEHVSVYSYGSGCHGEFCDAVLGARAGELARARRIPDHLANRLPIQVEDYEFFERDRDAQVATDTFRPERSRNHALYDSHYKGKGLLILQEVVNRCRSYAWT